jgi:hypothetical protein
MTAGSGLVILAILASFAIADLSSVVAQSSNPGLLHYLERVGQLLRLSKDCKLGNTPEFRMEARDFSNSEISDVLTRSPIFQKLVEADHEFSSGNFRGGFEKFGRVDMRPWLTTTNAQAVAHAIDATGVYITSPISDEILHVGRHKVEDLDLWTWIGRLIEMVPSGPLFRSTNARAMCFDENRLSSQHLNTAIRKAATRVGVRGDAISERLRALFDLERREIASETVVTRYDGLEKPRLNRSEARRATKLVIRKRRIEKRR